MSRSKKPHKPYKPKLTVIPGTSRRAGEFELPGYTASLALGTAWFAEQHVYDLLSNADMTRRCAPDVHPILPVAQAMVDACAAIQDRAMKTGKHGITGDELRILRDGLGLTMEFLRAVPNVKIARAALAATREFDRTGVLRV